MDKNKFAKWPPMGWNSYDYYDTTVSEEDVKKNADYMAANLKEFGWEYVVVDIQWYAHKPGTRRKEFQYIPFSPLEIDEYGRLIPDPERFPSSINGAGFKPLADYCHDRGLKFGIHIMRGIPRICAHEHVKILNGADAAEISNPSSICEWNPDMYGVRDCADGQAYYDSIIELYASWGVDFIKCDDICNTVMYPLNPYSGRHEIEMLSKAIDKSGREIVLSLSPGPALIEQAAHYEKHANMWRITGDFWDDWKLLKDMFWRCELWQNHVSAGSYPDCDMLPIGIVGAGFGEERPSNFTYDEAKTMMSLWSLFGSPLMMGCELTKLDEKTKTLLTNKDILGLLDPEKIPDQIRRDDASAVWTATNASELNVALFNLADSEEEISVTKEEIVRSWRKQNDNASIGEIKDWYSLWDGEILTFTDEKIGVKLPAHGCVVLRPLIKK